MKYNPIKFLPPYKLPFEAATAIIKDKKDRYLLLKRSLTSKSYQLHWQLPEGKIADGEIPIETLQRELKEELGESYSKNELKFLRKKRVLVKKMGLPLLYIDRYLFTCRPPTKIKLSDEHLEYAYYSLNRIKNLRGKLPGLLELIGGE